MLRRTVSLAVVAVLVLVGCGGDDADGEGDVADTTAAADAATDTTAAGDDDASGGDQDGEGDAGEAGEDENPAAGLDFGDGAALVTVGDDEYRFALGGTGQVDGITYVGVCNEVIGLLSGAGFDQDGRAITIDFEIPPPDWESDATAGFDPPRIRIEDEATGRYLAADQAIAERFPELAGSSQVDDWVSEGSSARGTATFIELTPAGSPVPGAAAIPGSFELGCAQDG